MEEDSRQKMIEKELEKTQDGKNVITLGRINENSNIQNKTAVITNVTFISHSLPLRFNIWVRCASNKIKLRLSIHAVM